MTGSPVRRGRREALAARAHLQPEDKVVSEFVSEREEKRNALVRKTARLYELVDEMNAIVNDLHGLGVIARFGGRARADDPLGQKAVVELTMLTDMEPLPRGF